MFEIDPVIFSLSNGLKVIYQHQNAFVAHLGLMVQAGSRYERENEEGLAHFLEHCIFQGTEKRRALDVFTDLDSLGGELNAYTNKEEMCVHASFRKAHFNIAADLISDIIQNSSFPRKEVNKEREVVIDEINSYLDTPAERIFDEFEEHVFRGHSIGRNTLGTKESLQRFSSKELKSFMERLFTVDNMVISFVGDIPLDEVKATLENYFFHVSKSANAKENGSIESFNSFQLEEKKANFQSHIVLGGRGPSYIDEDRKVMALLINVLGGPAMNSRLNLSVREKFGYAYNVEAGFSSYSDTGIWSVYLGTDKKHVKKVMKLVHKEIKSLCCDGLTDEELELAKEQIKGHLALSLDSNIELMLHLAKSLLIFGKVDSMSDLYEEIDAITSEETKKVASKWFDEENTGSLTFIY
jgi:predicted Zn-dependent peptidase